MAKTGGIPVYQSPELYKSALARHGQFVRWYSSLPCFCADEMGRVDPGCNKCRGKGHIYFPQERMRTIEERMGKNSKIIIPNEKIETLNKVYKHNGTELSVDSYTSSEIILALAPVSGSYFNIDYYQDLKESFVGTATYLGNGLLRALINKITNKQGDFVGEISSVNYLKNITQGINMGVLAYWEDLILTDGPVDIGDTLEVDCTYIDPIKFLVTNVVQKERLENSMLIQEGELQLTFDGFLPVGPGDLITLLKATQKAAVVGNYSGSGEHEVPFFHIKELIRVEDNLGKVEGVTIVKNNRLMFNERKPEGRFSVAFMYNPSFVVLEGLPSLRYGEDKVFPKRLPLKRYDMFNRRENRPSQPEDYF